MTRIAGVKMQKDSRGKVTHVTINVKKHKEAVPVLQNLGLMEKTQFEKDCESAITIEEARAHTHAFIKAFHGKSKIIKGKIVLLNACI